MLLRPLAGKLSHVARRRAKSWQLFVGCVIRTSVGIRRPSSATKSRRHPLCVQLLQAKKAVQILGPLLAKCSS